MTKKYFLAMHDKYGMSFGIIVSIDKTHFEHDNLNIISEYDIVYKFYNENYRKDFHYDGCYIINDEKIHEIKDKDLIQLYA